MSKSNYRIVEVRQGDKVHWEIETNHWLYGWYRETNSLYSGSNIYRTLGDAEDQIKKHMDRMKKTERTIIKEV